MSRVIMPDTVELFQTLILCKASIHEVGKNINANRNDRALMLLERTEETINALLKRSPLGCKVSKGPREREFRPSRN